MNIAGTPKAVQSFDHEIIRKYHEEHYKASNLVIAVAGNVEHEQVVDLAQVSFGTGSDKNPRSKTKDQKPIPDSPIIIKNNPNLEQAHLIIATPFVSETDKRRYAADLLESIIGGGTSSRLWQKVREERGLAYSVGASAIMYQDCGMFSIFAGTSPQQVAEVVDLAVAEMRDIVNNGITLDELNLAKQQTVSSILLSLEDSASRAASLAQLEMTHGHQISVEESIEKVTAVTLEDIRSLAEEYFRSENIAFAALGDLKDLRIDRSRLTI
jgi:predicted Zn-dependent peptidase